VHRRCVVALVVAITSVLGVITTPPASPAQPTAGKVYRIGLLDTTLTLRANELIQ
jgi:hypothetical protein